MGAAPAPCGVPHDRSQPGTRFARHLTLPHQGTAQLRLESTTSLVDWSAQAVCQATNGVNRWTNAAGLGGSGIFFRRRHLGSDAPGP